MTLLAKCASVFSRTANCRIATSLIPLKNSVRFRFRPSAICAILSAAKNQHGIVGEAYDRRSSGVNAAVPRAHQSVRAICTRSCAPFIPGGCVTRSQIPGDLSGFGSGRCFPASTNRRCDHSRPGDAYWVLSQLPLCSPFYGLDRIESFTE